MREIAPEIYMTSDKIMLLGKSRYKEIRSFRGRVKLMRATKGFPLLKKAEYLIHYSAKLHLEAIPYTINPRRAYQ